MRIRNYAKAIAGFIVPGLTVVGMALTGGSDAGSTITPSEWVNAVLASLATLTAVYAVSNDVDDSDSGDTSYGEGVDTLPGI